MKRLFFFEVHCKWGPWVETECPETCGIEANSTLKRSIEVKADFGGTNCTGESKMVEKCPFVPCPGKPLNEYFLAK